MRVISVYVLVTVFTHFLWNLKLLRKWKKREFSCGFSFKLHMENIAYLSFLAENGESYKLLCFCCFAHFFSNFKLLGKWKKRKVFFFFLHSHLLRKHCLLFSFWTEIFENYKHPIVKFLFWLFFLCIFKTGIKD